MGRQVNFYLTYLDQRLLLQEFNTKLDIVCVIPSEKTSNPVLRDVTECAEWKRDENTPYLLRPNDISYFKWYYVKAWGGYLPENQDMPAVEFWRCISRESKISRGRFYYQATYINEQGYITEKSSEFITFAKKIFSITKKFCPLLEDGNYIGPDAERARREGIKFIANF